MQQAAGNLAAGYRPAPESQPAWGGGSSASARMAARSGASPSSPAASWRTDRGWMSDWMEQMSASPSFYTQVEALGLETADDMALLRPAELSELGNTLKPVARRKLLSIYTYPSPRLPAQPLRRRRHDRCSRARADRRHVVAAQQELEQAADAPVAFSPRAPSPSAAFSPAIQANGRGPADRGRAGPAGAERSAAAGGGGGGGGRGEAVVGGLRLLELEPAPLGSESPSPGRQPQPRSPYLEQAAVSRPSPCSLCSPFGCWFWPWWSCC